MGRCGAVPGVLAFLEAGLERSGAGGASRDGGRDGSEEKNTVKGGLHLSTYEKGDDSKMVL